MSSFDKLEIPDALKPIKPYMTLGVQLDQRNEGIVAYYCRLYALQTAMSINKSAPECKKFLLQLMDLVEASKEKKKAEGEEAITSNIIGQAIVEKQALMIFAKADMEDRDGKFTKNLVKQFYTSGLLFDTLNYFGDLSEDLVAKKHYAKRKAMYLNRCFQTGETPIAGPLIGEEGVFNQNEAASDQGVPSAPAPVQPQYYESPPNPKPRTPQPNVSDNYGQEPVASNVRAISSEDVVKAQKMCKFASSALEYEDFATAISNLEKCLALLKH